MVLVVAGAVGGYVVKHNADVKQRQRQERVERADREYRARVAKWRQALQQWNSRQAGYQSCKDVTSDTFSAMDEIQGKVTGGLNYNEYSDAVADVSSAVSRAIRESGRSDNGLGLRCLTDVTHPLATASDEYSTAAEIWRKWYNGVIDGTDGRSIDDLPLDAHWSKADGDTSDAQFALEDMQPGPKPVKPRRGSPGTGGAGRSV